jgi:hypothetical protein
MMFSRPLSRSWRCEHERVLGGVRQARLTLRVGREARAEAGVDRVEVLARAEARLLRLRRVILVDPHQLDARQRWPPSRATTVRRGPSSLGGTLARSPVLPASSGVELVVAGVEWVPAGASGRSCGPTSCVSCVQNQTAKPITSRTETNTSGPMRLDIPSHASAVPSSRGR